MLSTVAAAVEVYSHHTQRVRAVGATGGRESGKSLSPASGSFLFFGRSVCICVAGRTHHTQSGGDDEKKKWKE